MTPNYTPVYNGNGFTNLEITLDAMAAANASPELFKQFNAAIRANADQGYQLLLDPAYFAWVKENALGDIEDLLFLASKVNWGARILEDTDYLDQMTRLAIKKSLAGVATVVNGQQVITALIPAQVINGVFQPIADSIIIDAVAHLSNDNNIIRVLSKRNRL